MCPICARNSATRFKSSRNSAHRRGNGEILTTAKKIDEMDDEMLLW
jgi:hypothetical protein